MSRLLSRRTLLGTGVVAALGGAVGCAPVQTKYQPSGEGIVDVVVPYGTGGGTDTWARFITPYFAELQPDVDRYQIENLPGGETITGTNAFVRAGVTNGRQALVASATTYFQSMLGQSTAEFDFARMEPLALNGTGAVLWTSAESGIRSIEDLMGNATQYRYGGMSASGLDLVPLLALEALGANVRGVFGMEGRGPTRLAVERGESDLDFQTTSSYLSQVKPKVDTGEAIPLFAVGSLENGEVRRDKNLPDIPTFAEIFEGLGHRTERQELAYSAFQSFVVPGFFYQKGLWANAGTSSSVIETYDELVSELNQDDQFLEEAKDALGGYDLVSGSDAKADFRRALEMDEDVLAFTKTVLEDKYDAVLD
ncbi:Bug family tripartite tricarboxylate transporter substrate binding protein [Citricoccus sp. GCM10030269]|uniref:Bug family tripartite tricarboxylate transporter substrate binding protein n=1 Tax=Citricoccus sp. GCM10030269 TaxID=3273388 RepID=UPI0036093110